MTKVNNIKGKLIKAGMILGIGALLISTQSNTGKVVDESDAYTKYKSQYQYGDLSNGFMDKGYYISYWGNEVSDPRSTTNVAKEIWNIDPRYLMYRCVVNTKSATKTTYDGKASWTAKQGTGLAVTGNFCTEKTNTVTSTSTLKTLKNDTPIKVANVPVSNAFKRNTTFVSIQKNDFRGMNIAYFNNFTPKFKDVPVEHSQWLEIETLARKGIIAGTSATTFSPNANITNKQMATLMTRALGLKGKYGYNYKFTHKYADIESLKNNSKTKENYYEIMWAMEEGIFEKTSKFNPNNAVTRGQMALALYNGFGMSDVKATKTFKDVAKNNKYYTAVNTLATQGITSGTTATTFSPNNKITRGQFSVFLIRSMDNRYAQVPFDAWKGTIDFASELGGFKGGKIIFKGLGGR